MACIGGMYRSHKCHDNDIMNNVHTFMYAAEDEITMKIAHALDVQSIGFIKDIDCINRSESKYDVQGMQCPYEHK